MFVIAFVADNIPFILEDNSITWSAGGRGAITQEKKGGPGILGLPFNGSKPSAATM